MNQREWIEKQKEQYPNADSKVLEYIGRILYNQGEKGCKIIEGLFTEGYCWYFANMLKSAFHGGEVCACYTYDIGHFVWIYNNVAYDICGVYKPTKIEYLIPESELGTDILNDFKHIPGVYNGMGENEIFKRLLEIIRRKAYIKLGKKG